MNARKSGHESKRGLMNVRRPDHERTNSLVDARRSGHTDLPSGTVWTYRLSVWDVSLRKFDRDFWNWYTGYVKMLPIDSGDIVQWFFDGTFSSKGIRKLV